jgi:hypothetical protein
MAGGKSAAATRCSSNTQVACEHSDAPRQGERETSVEIFGRNPEPEAPTVLQFHADLLHEKLTRVQHQPRRWATAEESYYEAKMGNLRHWEWTGVFTPTPPDSPKSEAQHTPQNRDIVRHHIRSESTIAPLSHKRRQRSGRQAERSHIAKTAHSRDGIRKKPMRPSKHSMITRSKGKQRFIRAEQSI